MTMLTLWFMVFLPFMVFLCVFYKAGVLNKPYRGAMGSTANTRAKGSPNAMDASAMNVLGVVLYLPF
jgi:hypothetical protein